MKKYFLSFALFMISISFLYSQTSDSGLQTLTKEKVEAPLEFLASDWTEGREAGTKGAYLAADYIAGLFKIYGLLPLGDTDFIMISRERRMQGEKQRFYRSYFQNFDMLTGTRKADHELYLNIATTNSTYSKKLIGEIDYQIQSDPGTIEINAPIVFLGYGIANESVKNNPYQQKIIKGKIVFIIGGFPGMNDTLSENYKNLVNINNSLSQIERRKIQLAKEAGALAVVKYNPGNKKMVSLNPVNLPFFHDNEYYEGDEKQDDYYLKRLRLPDSANEAPIPVIQINTNIAELLSGDRLAQLLKPGYSLSEFKPVELENFRINLKTKNDQEVIKVRNVLGYIEGENTKEAILIGAHYDHVGKYNGFIFNGADDNASGTAGMLALANAFIERGLKPSKTIIFAAWTAEEQGLWGSKYFVRNMEDSLKIVLNVNLDMISRTSIKDSSSDFLSLVYTKGHEEFEEIFKKINNEKGFRLNIEYKSEVQPKGGSDFTPFAEKNIPVISLFTGLHRDYHMPDDEVENLDIDKMVDIIRLTYLGISEILDKP